LSPDGITKRVALLDNVKTLRFSWAELESMITAPLISGKQMYVGEASRPNNLVWVITLNGANLSTDMAQRCVIIKIKRPQHSATWEEDTYAYIDSHRTAIIADLIAFLRTTPATLVRYSRWGAWERDILAKLPEPADAQKVIAERQEIADVEGEESKIVEDFFLHELQSLGYSPDTQRIFIPSPIVTRWFNTATNENHKSTSVTRTLNQHIGEKAITRLQYNKCNTYGRGFEWAGPDAKNDTHTDIESRIAAREDRRRHP